MKYVSDLKSAMDVHKEQAFKLNYAIANDPELSGEEFHACQHYIDACRSLGMDVEEHFTGQKTAFRAVVSRAQKPVLKIALLAEYDALPGVGHGCGHSANGAMSFLAAAALKDLKDLPVDVDLIGTPDEELRGGKVIMCEQGVFNDYDLAVMVHISPTKTNANSHFLALDDYRIAFHGQTAHAAGEPWNGRNALNGAMLALHGIDMLRQHVRPETRIGSYIVDGGQASNVVPDYAEVECCIRHSERAYLDTVVAKVMKCFEGAAIATETTYDVKQMGCKFDNMVWNDTATKAAEQVLTDMGIAYEAPKDCGSSDVGNVSHQCPALHLHLALGDVPMPEHSVEIANAVKAPSIEPIIVKGAEIMGRLAILLAGDEKRCQAMMDEFKDHVAVRV
ncbi:M20 family metallopeptidase [Megasphaera sp.]|uniref:M20 family metallopeptidase n=1 Tax=Megasphaera sp. TaxID=2023260 RepID=UPI0027BB12C1|nr:M20 family metallopeptidase [Megasphaera sp.]